MSSHTLSIDGHPRPKEGYMFNVVGQQETQINPWWAAAVAPLLLFIGAVLKTWVDLSRGRAGDDARWRAELIEWNTKQQAQLDNLEKRVKDEQELRHQVKNELHKEQMAHELLKQEYAHTKAECDHHRSELEAMRLENVKLKAEIERLCAQMCGKLPSVQVNTAEPPQQ